MYKLFEDFIYTHGHIVWFNGWDGQSIQIGNDYFSGENFSSFFPYVFDMKPHIRMITFYNKKAYAKCIVQNKTMDVDKFVYETNWNFLNRLNNDYHR